MDYAEASYFDGYAFQHIAAYYDHLRLKRLRRDASKAVARRAECGHKRRYGTGTQMFASS